MTFKDMKLRDKIVEVLFIAFIISAIYLLSKSVSPSDSREPFKSSHYYNSKSLDEIEKQDNFVNDYISKYNQYVIKPISKYSLIDNDLKRELLDLQIKSCNDALNYSLRRPFLNEDEMIIIFNGYINNLLSKFNYLNVYYNSIN